MNLNKTGDVRIKVTLRRVRVTIFAREKQGVLHILNVCLCVFVALVNQHTNFSHGMSLKARFSKEKQLLNTKCVSIFSTAFVCKISHSKKNSARYYHKCSSVFM